MKRLLIIPLLFCFLFLQGANKYYVAPSTATPAGNDANAGTIDAPWATIDKVNAVWLAGTFAPGDSIQFKRSYTYYGTLTVKESGSSGSPIIIGAYGTGADPIITGFTTITGWTDEGGGIYSKVISPASAPNLVTVDGVNTAIGRYPDSATGYLTIDSHTTNTVIVDAALPASPDWDGAEVVIRKNHWIIDRNTITNHTGTSITYTSASSYNAIDGYGYFIQSDLETLTSLGEWYYNAAATKFYMYFGAVDPTSKTVKVATLDKGIYIYPYSYITIDNIDFQGYNTRIIDIKSSSYIVIQNCSISYSGYAGIWGGTNGGANSNYLIVNNCNITECNNYGIWIGSEFQNATISNSVVHEIAEIAGMGGSGDGHGVGIGNSVASGTIIEYNDVHNIGYIPVLFSGNNVKVRYNFVHDYCYVKDDGAGLYTSTANYTGREVLHNIILNGLGAAAGTTGTGSANGIYCDDRTVDVIIHGNTISNVNYGIYLHNSQSDTLTNNLSYNNRYAIAIIHDNNASTYPIRYLKINANKFISKATTQNSMLFATRDGSDDIDEFGTADSNYYARPINNTTLFRLYPNGWSKTNYTYTLAQWKTYSSQDAHSLGSPITVTDTSKIDFYYNASQTNDSVFTLPYASIDIEGTKYATELNLDAYQSAVLMEDPDPDSDPPDIPTVTQSVTTYKAYSITIASVVSGANVGTLSSKGICYNTTGNPTTADTKTVEAAGVGSFSTSVSMAKSTTYYFRTYAVNDLGTTYSSIIEYTTPAKAYGVSGGKILVSGGKYLIY